eukprot:NODE_75_length_23955_cov_0.435069.p13 type:complete len:252 gc:universal NODE_75_length_23955_cov_0.435069:13688-14443(+)
MPWVLSLTEFYSRTSRGFSKICKYFSKQMTTAFDINTLPMIEPVPQDADTNESILHFYHLSVKYAPVDLMISHHFAKLATCHHSNSSSVIYSHAMQWYNLLKYVIYQEYSETEQTHIFQSYFKESKFKQIPHSFKQHVPIYTPPHHLLAKKSTHCAVKIKSTPKQLLNDLMDSYHLNVLMPVKYDARYECVVYTENIKPVRPLPIGIYKNPLTNEEFNLLNLISFYKSAMQLLTTDKKRKRPNEELMDFDE